MRGTLRELLKVSIQKLKQPNQAVIPRQSYFNIVGDCIKYFIVKGQYNLDIKYVHLFKMMKIFVT